MNLVKKVRFRRQHDTSPRAKFLSVNQQKKGKWRQNVSQKYTKKITTKKPETDDKSRKSQQKVRQKR